MRRKKFGHDEGGFFDDDFFEEFDRIEEMMREMLESHFKGFSEDDVRKLDDFRPKVYGFTLEFGPEGKGKLTEFGAKPGSGVGGVGKQAARQKERPERGEPFTDVIEHPGSITVIAELPGVLEKDLHLKAFPKQLNLRVSDPDRLFSKTIALPAEVLWDSLKSSLKNGILEVVLKKKK